MIILHDLTKEGEAILIQPQKTDETSIEALSRLDYNDEGEPNDFFVDVFKKIIELRGLKHVGKIGFGSWGSLYPPISNFTPCGGELRYGLLPDERKFDWLKEIYPIGFTCSNPDCPLHAVIVPIGVKREELDRSALLRMQSALLHLMVKQMTPFAPFCNFLHNGKSGEREIRDLGTLALAQKMFFGRLGDTKHITGHFSLAFTLKVGIQTIGPDNQNGFVGWRSFLEQKMWEHRRYVSQLAESLLLGPKPNY